MKELSIEEKAKRYDEAIEKGNQILNTPYTAHWDIMKEVTEHLFPELAESEDEKIRKAVVDAVVTLSDSPLKTKMLAWLEKQGERNPAWSEEDEEIHRKCICAMRASACGFPEEEKFVEQVDNWLKSLKDRVQPRQEQEWSEEDEFHLKSIESTIEYCKKEVAENDEVRYLFSEDFNWLKSLKDRYTWKPSDEQMNALSKAIAFVFDSNSAVKHTLESLYNELKKL